MMSQPNYDLDTGHVLFMPTSVYNMWSAL